MHRHGYKGRKFGRERDQRRALIKGLATSLVMEEKIETTLPKAKELVRYIEKLVTKAKRGDLAVSMRLPRTLRVLAMTLSNRIYASYRWIGVHRNCGSHINS